MLIGSHAPAMLDTEILAQGGCRVWARKKNRVRFRVLKGRVRVRIRHDLCTSTGDVNPNHCVGGPSLAPMQMIP